MRTVGLVKKIWVWVMVVAGILALHSCESQGPQYADTLTSGTIHISVDESFKPVIDSQIKVFESQHPDAHIIVHYKPEAECLRDLNNDSIRMVIVTRGLSEEELKTLTEKLSFAPSFAPMAFDAIAVIVNGKSKDSLFTMQDIRSVVKGTSSFKYKVLMDGATATSTVRYVKDSLLSGEPMSKNVVAAPNSEGVIDYVSKNDDAIGLIGVSWIGNPDDTTQLNFLQKVKIASIECRGCANGPYVKPYQANIYYDRYPMLRGIYYIVKENYEGLGSGFKNFLIYDKGQRIFKRAYLLPARMKFGVQTASISE
ncbi:MAG: substrate-binding domain-containing protein [Chitinophagaceae bacterium]